MSWYLNVLKNYAGFSGRARRTEFWMYTLINFIIVVVLGLIDRLIGTPLLVYIYELAVLVPTLAVTWRRLHDTDRSGAWWFIALIPLVGWIVLLVFTVQAGTAGPNKFGADPKPLTATA